MLVQALAVNCLLYQCLNQGNASAWGLPLVGAQGVGGAVGKAVAAFYTAVGFCKHLFWTHHLILWLKSFVDGWALIVNSWGLGLRFNGLETVILANYPRSI